MVLKPDARAHEMESRFYSSVILNGTETFGFCRNHDTKFYSSVILNGTETLFFQASAGVAFYSSVILNGTETYPYSLTTYWRFTVVLY